MRWEVAVGADGCVFRQEDGLCHLHARHGWESKPALCRGFPYAITMTPKGARVSTAHRCPCRSLGDRAPIDAESVLRALTEEGQVELFATIEEPLRVGERTTASFATYEGVERRLLASLLSDEPLDGVLGGNGRLPRLDGRWEDEARAIATMGQGPMRGAIALRWFGTALLGVAVGASLAAVDRPWKFDFDQAERGGTRRSGRALLGDWVADELWGLGWTDVGSLARAKAEWRSCVLIAQKISDALVFGGHSEERSMAEAVMIVELVTATPIWRKVVRSFIV